MPTISDVIQALNPFSNHENIIAILTTLRRIYGKNHFFQSGFKKNEINSIIPSLRSSLMNILSADENAFIVKDGIYLTVAVYNALLILDELSPVNMRAPKLREIINPANKLVVSTGHQFDIYALIAFHNNRYAKVTDKEDIRNDKKLINPITNQKFSYTDSSHIQAFAEQKQISIEWLVDKNKGSTRELARFIKTRADHISIDELTDYLENTPENLINDSIKYFTEIINSPNGMNFFMLLVAFSSAGTVMSGYVLDHLVVDIADIIQPSSPHFRAGFWEAGIALGGLMIIGALITKYLSPKVNLGEVSVTIQRKVDENSITTIDSIDCNITYHRL